MEAVMTLSGTEQNAWINRPEYSEISEDRIVIVSDAHTDFWENTHYGFSHYTGHAYGKETESDFTFQVRIKADFKTLYDQAGIFIGGTKTAWIKAGIEFNDGQPAIGCVVTDNNADWSTGVFPGNPGDFWMRVTSKSDVIRIQYSIDGENWPLLRLCRWPGAGKKFIGVMCCSPKRKGLSAEFTDILLTPPLDRELHDLS
ncbi:DUF1349 domain-containing protein [Pectobacterium sp. CHL-2024]|uniref:DUF1349 domain-containing protein n=1 Tax=Pectobacterium sp. CHL-2024 TaxID=3377079 RepID=UPI00380DA031